MFGNRTFFLELLFRTHKFQLCLRKLSSSLAKLFQVLREPLILKCLQSAANALHKFGALIGALVEVRYYRIGNDKVMIISSWIREDAQWVALIRIRAIRTAINASFEGENAENVLNLTAAELRPSFAGQVASR